MFTDLFLRTRYYCTVGTRRTLPTRFKSRRFLRMVTGSNAYERRKNTARLLPNIELFVSLFLPKLISKYILAKSMTVFKGHMTWVCNQ